MQNSINVSDNDTKNLTVLSRQNVLDKDFTVYGSVENPLFLAKDVAEWIDYAKTSKGAYNVSMMLNSIDEDEKLVSTILVSGQNRECSFVTENGLYEILMLSRKPIAKQFKKEVKKILHQIRTTGGYTVPRTFADALRLAAEQQERIALMQPKADVYDKICNSETLKSVDTVASNLGYGKNNFFALMRGMGIFYYSSKDADGKKINLPKQEYKDRGYFVTKEEPYNRGDKDCLYTKIYVTGKGETWLTKKLIDETSDAFIEKCESEYKKIIDNTANNYIERAIERCPECNNTYIDIIKTYTFKQVADAAGENEQTIINFCRAKGWIDDNNKPLLVKDNHLFFKGLLTQAGRDHIVATYLSIKEAEKGMRKTEFGKAE